MSHTKVPLVEQYPQITEILKSGSFKKFVESRLFVHKLHRHYEAGDITNQVYVEFDKAVETGRYKETGYLSAWCRKTAYYIISNLAKRKNSKEVVLDSNTLDSIKACSQEFTVYETTILTLRQALKQLNPEDEKIVTLHFLKNLKYQQIFDVLTEDGSNISSVDAIRKRVERAKAKLRKIYAQEASQF